jgi:ubiquinone/menaquinone biosynthesis C-methylase UbiE
MRVPAMEGHRLWASIYDSAPNPVLLLERRVMWDVLKSLHPTTVIDVACGTGQWLRHFQRTGSEVFGCDASKEMLSEAAKISSLRGRIALGEAECIPFRASTADLVLCSISLGYFRDIHQVFREFGRAAKPGGFISVSDLHPDALTSGWTRSFKLGDCRYEIEHYHRSIREIRCAASCAGLNEKRFDSAHFGAPELPVFRGAGRESQFEAASAVPALFIAAWEKPC